MHFCSAIPKFVGRMLRTRMTSKQISSLHRLIVVGLMSCFCFQTASAQCTESGFVLEKDVKCGAQILNTATGEIFWAVAGAEQLQAGKLCSFDRLPFAGTNSCIQPVFEQFSLTCVSLSVPCQAEFTYTQDATDALLFHFDAHVTDPIKHIASWSFGDGTQASGVNVSHAFSQIGQYQVCLSVSDPTTGCTEQKCLLVDVMAVNPQTCGKVSYVTSMDLNLMGEIRDQSMGLSTLKTIEWSLQKTNTPLGNSSSFHFPLPQYGEYTVCANYTTTLINGAECVARDCKVINVIPATCKNSLIQSNVALCPTVYTPVCGCDGNTYGNECEAMLNGISSWWLGTCASASVSSCVADLSFEYLSGSLDQGFWVRFRNLSQGSYSKSRLDFGDGSPVYEQIYWDTVSHFYATAGLFLANLTVWKPDGSVNSVSKVLYTDSQSALQSALPSLGNVWPGDTDGSGKADVADLHNLGLGYWRQGAPRPNAMMEWIPQMAPNWDQQTPTQVNYKHIDADGNGTINELDVNPIQLFNKKLESVPVTNQPGLPEVSIRFLQDTIVFDPNIQATVNIAAELYVGKALKPVDNLYGLSLALEYPDFANQNTIAYYTGEQFFGHSNEILWLQKNHYTSRQLDLGFVRKNRKGIDGFGRMAQINVQSDIIIIIDLIERQSATMLPFTIKTNSIKATDAEGMPLDLTVPSVSDTVWIKVLPLSVSTYAPVLNQIQVRPNPVTHSAQITLPQGTRSIRCVDALGRILREWQVESMTQDTEVVDMSDLPKGSYTLHILTDKGSYTKEVIKM